METVPSAWHLRGIVTICAAILCFEFRVVCQSRAHYYYGRVSNNPGAFDTRTLTIKAVLEYPFHSRLPSRGIINVWCCGHNLQRRLVDTPQTSSASPTRHGPTVKLHLQLEFDSAAKLSSTRIAIGILSCVAGPSALARYR